jgi:hypothetical protein
MDIEKFIIFELVWNICNYGCIVCMNGFWVYNFFLICKKLSSDGQHLMSATSNTLPVTGSLPVTSNLLPVTAYQ